MLSKIGETSREIKEGIQSGFRTRLRRDEMLWSLSLTLCGDVSDPLMSFISHRSRPGYDTLQYVLLLCDAVGGAFVQCGHSLDK